MYVRDFEAAVWNTEGIRIVIRCSQRTQVGEYDYQNAAPEAWTVTKLLSSRIQGLVGDHDVDVVRGDGTLPPGNSRSECFESHTADNYRRLTKQIRERSAIPGRVISCFEALPESYRR